MVQHIKAHITTPKPEPKVRVTKSASKRDALSAMAKALTGRDPLRAQQRNPMAELLAMINGGGGDDFNRRGSDVLADEADDVSLGASTQETLHEALSVLQYLGERYSWDAEKIEVIAALCADSATARRTEQAIAAGEPFLNVDARNALIEKLRTETDQRISASGGGGRCAWIGDLTFKAADMTKDALVTTDEGPDYEDMVLRGVRTLGKYISGALSINGALWTTLHAYETAVQKKLESQGSGYDAAAFVQHAAAAERVGARYAQELITGISATPWDAEAQSEELPPVLRGSGVGGPGAGEGLDLEEEEEAITRANVAIEGERNERSTGYG